jgi:hypothetical protein
LIGVAALCAVSANGSAAHASPEFLTYEGRDAVQEGQGGERKTVDGIDFWMRGDPPRRFQILGSLTDRRHQSGLIGMARMASLDSDIAKAAKGAGGDAVILEAEDSDVIGGSSYANTVVNGGGAAGGFHANAFTVGGSHLIRKHDSRWLVVRYLPDAPASAPGPPGALPAQAAPPPSPPS